MKSKNEIRREIASLVTEYYQSAFVSKNAFNPGKDIVHYAGRVFDEQELKNLVDASLDFWLTSGRFNEEFETELGRFLNIDNAITVNSGSSANLVALSSLTSPKLKDRRIKPGDEVITAAAGFPTTVNPIIQNQAIPVFVDVELGTYVPSIKNIEAAISSKTKAVMIAHTMGVPYELEQLKDLCRKKGIWLVEDNCDALGSKYDGKYTGTFGDISTLSFYPAHHITMGEGGAVISNDEQLINIARSFRDWGRDCYCKGGENNTCGKRFSQQFGTLPVGYDHKYVYSHIGYNLKITDMQAAVGVAQLKKLNKFIEERRKNHSVLSEALINYQDQMVLHSCPEKAEPSWFGYVITMRPEGKFCRSDIVSRLEEQKIETRNLFCGNILRHPAYENITRRIAGSLENTEIITTNTFFIGVYPGLSDAMIGHVVDTFNEIFK
jgi:CDP-4-dehydro-6-deoxyglucose reductase, E1